jgi:Flp pilus assembly protein TadB
MGRGDRGRGRQAGRPTSLDYVTGVSGLVGAVAALIAAVAGLLTAVTSTLVGR